MHITNLLHLILIAVLPADGPLPERETVTFQIAGLSSSCHADSIEWIVLGDMEGILEYEANTEHAKITIAFDPKAVTVADFVATLNRSAFKVLASSTHDLTKIPAFTNPAKGPPIKTCGAASQAKTKTCGAPKTASATCGEKK